MHLSNKRLGLVTDALDKAAAGTVEAALRNLIAYRSSLENRLLARFMDACSQSVRSPCMHVLRICGCPVCTVVFVYCAWRVRLSPTAGVWALAGILNECMRATLRVLCTRVAMTAEESTVMGELTLFSFPLASVYGYCAQPFCCRTCRVNLNYCTSKLR